MLCCGVKSVKKNSVFSGWVADCGGGGECVYLDVFALDDVLKIVLKVFQIVDAGVVLTQRTADVICVVRVVYADRIRLILFSGGRVSGARRDSGYGVHVFCLVFFSRLNRLQICTRD